jgi:hypothetical protein
MIIFAGLIVFGGGMIISSIQKRQIRRLDAGVNNRQTPDWIRNSPRKEYFTNYLEKIEPASPIASLIRVYLMSLSQSQFKIPSARAEFRLIRTLKTSHEMESSVVLTYARRKEVDEIQLHVVRAAKEPFTCRVTMREGAIEHVNFGDEKEGGESLNASRLYALPIGFGDLQLADLMAFYKLLGSGLSITPIGFLEAEGTERLLVLDMDFPKNPALENIPDSVSTTNSFSGRGASALVYINSRNYRLRRALVFDAESRLVRIYEDFTYQTEDKNSPIESFRATSLVTSSHTIFQLDQLTLDK